MRGEGISEDVFEASSSMYGTDVTLGAKVTGQVMP